MTNRKAPTKYVNQYPLYMKGYQNVQMVEEFLQDIQTNQPRIIVDASSNDKWTPPINLAKRKVWEESPDASIYILWRKRTVYMIV
ncbi:hypothetical protein D4T97_016015 [Siminovitchia acidinfaciens]|uniref:Uncharacterized protein n=1 Tax=Siminovitchia acidinfaciens TaxID=2321395 RepID=A0A429XW26_9BACI|nr:hypothetical protein [Siminovitchia acidinfaciens]RST72560.1 hypothetical protein D4T97_016015 [Siminovitchia acidinfaciens]